MTKTAPTRAMVLAAGRGQRMRPISDRLPKPLVEIQARSLIDRVLDRLQAAGVTEVVVNLHHLGDQLRAHLDQRSDVAITYSPEAELLETGGGLVQALPLLDADPFYAVNGDVLWLDGARPALQRLAEAWDPERMDALLLLQPTVTAFGYEGMGDFRMAPGGELSLRPEREPAPFVFSGIQLLSPRLFAGRKAEPFRLITLYRQAVQSGRLFGLRHDGLWFHVGRPEDIATTEEALEELGFHRPAA
ncbi:MAG: nucleotidyltransferase family protein [Pseudomonadota bacterium]